MGMIGLALDGRRCFLVNNDLQGLADAATLAGAARLDGGTNNGGAIGNPKRRRETSSASYEKGYRGPLLALGRFADFRP